MSSGVIHMRIYCHGAKSLAILLLLVGFISKSISHEIRIKEDLILLFDDQGVPRRVQIWGWGRGGKGEITDKFAKVGGNSLKVIAPEPLSGAVIGADFGLFESLPWNHTFLKFWLKIAEGEKGLNFNVHISTVMGDADCYFSIDQEAEEDGWFLVRLPILHFRNFTRLGGKIRAIGFKSAGRVGESCKQFFIDGVAFEVAKESITSAKFSPKASVKVDRQRLVAGSSLQLTLDLEEQCGVFARIISEKGAVGRVLFRNDSLGVGKHSIQWNGLGDEIREPWGALRWERVDRAFLPDGKYVLLVTVYRTSKESINAVDKAFEVTLYGFGDEREIRIYHKPPGMWMHASKIALSDPIKMIKTITLKQELNPRAFGSLFPDAFIVRCEGVDFTEDGIVLGKTSPKNIALNAEVKVCAEEVPNATWGGWRGLIDGSDAWWMTPQNYPQDKPIWFEITLPKDALVAKVMVKQAHGVEERSRIKKLTLRFDDGSETTLSLPKDTACHWFYIEPPKKTRKIFGEAREFWGERRGRCGLSEFQVFEAATYNFGYFITNDIMPIGAIRWSRFAGIHKGNGLIRWEYSLDHGESWHPIPTGGDMSKIPIKWGVIRFKCTIGGNVTVNGFEFSWQYDPKRPLARALDKKTCALSVKDGKFYDMSGKRIRLFGWWYSPPLELKGRTHIDFNEWLAEREREIAAFAYYGINCVRLGVPGTLYLPDGEDAFPDSPKYWEIMAKNGYCPLFPKMVDELINLLARYGIYTIFEFHDNPPWGYFSPIPISGAKTHPQDYPKAFEFARHRISKLWQWVAKHFKGNPFIVGFEVPWNEPLIGQRPWAIKTREDSRKYDQIYRELVEGCVKAIKSEDPQRICILGPNGWNSIRNDDPWIAPSSYWLFPKGIDAFHYHDYPQHRIVQEGTLCEWYAYPRASRIPLVRTEGHCFYFFWNKHDLEPGWGERGVDSILAQEFAMGIEGTVGWGHGGGEREIFGIGFARYHAWCRFWQQVNPRREAEVAIVMASEKRHNRDLPPHPVVEALLGLHVVPFDFLFDECILVKPNWMKRYKALILFAEGLPEEVINAAKAGEIPCFEFDRGKKDVVEKLALFLQKNGVTVDQKSPPNILIAYGDSGVVFYERKGKGGSYRIFLNLRHRGKIKLVDECTDEILYEGDSEKLGENGVKIGIEPFRAKLIRIIAP